MQIRRALEEQIFQKIHLGNLVYNTCWEDPRCDRALLNLQPDSEVVMLTSAGCNALDYLLDNPSTVHAVDINPRQNALLHLKTALIGGADHRVLFDFFGQGVSRERRAVYHDVLAEQLPEPYSDRFWRHKLDYFSGQGLRRSFYWHGSSGVVAWSVRQWLHTRPRMLRLVNELFESETLTEQRERYARVEPLLLNGLFRWVFKQHVVHSLLGVPRSQQILAAQRFEEGMLGYLRHCLRHVFTQLPLRDNYFWKLYFLGHYTPDCCPNYLRPEHYATLRSRVSRLRTHTSTLSDFLEKHPGSYSHFVLLDHQDWLAAHLRPELDREWRLLLENARPGAKVLLRSAAFEVDFLPDFVRERVAFDQPAAQESQTRDRVGTYASTWFGVIQQ